MRGDLSLVLIFAAGLLSFFSPCVLPLIPSYLGILGGIGLAKKPEERAGEDAENSPGKETFIAAGTFRPRLVLAASGFVLGFSAVFVVMGILVSATFSLMGGITFYVRLLSGVVVIILGLNVIFDFLVFLNYEKRLHIKPRRGGGVFGAFAAGAAFASGWTPCIGPVLTGILMTAGQSGKTGTAVFYLAVYSAGLGLPFIIAAVFFGSFVTKMKKLSSSVSVLRRISGIVLIIMGVMILTGQYSAFNMLIQSYIFRYIDWAEDKALPLRLFAGWLEWLQKF